MKVKSPLKNAITLLRILKSEKTPGTDGFPSFFWPEINKEMTESFNFALQSRKLSITQRRGIISLIPRKFKDKTTLENPRPISLLA